MCSRTWCCFFVSAALLSCMAGVGQSQDPKKNFEKNADLREQLFKGDVAADPKNKLHQNIADVCAEYYVPLRKTVELQAAVNKLMDKKNEKAKLEFRQLLGYALAKELEGPLADVKNDPGGAVHTAMMLPVVARLKTKGTSGLLIKLVEDNATHDAVRVWALKAFRETMPIEVQPESWPNLILNFKAAAENDRRKHDIGNVKALEKYITRQVKTGGMTSEEIATLRYLRREAIASLAAAGTPAVYAFAKNPPKDFPAMNGAIAPTLLKVLTPGALEPEATLQEKVDAAVGLCAMDYANMPDYQPEVAVYLVGRTIMDFVEDYQKDVPNLGAVGKKLPANLPWRHDGRRLQQGLTQLMDNAKVADAKDHPTAKATMKTIATLQLATKSFWPDIDKYASVNLTKLQVAINDVAKLQTKIDGTVFKTNKVTVPIK
jgi:hypothetical protein